MSEKPGWDGGLFIGVLRDEKLAPKREATELEDAGNFPAHRSVKFARQIQSFSRVFFAESRWKLRARIPPLVPIGISNRV